RVDGGTARAGELDRGQADSGRAAVHQERLARHQPAALEHVGPHGEEVLRERRCLEQGQAPRHRQCLADRGHRVLRVAAAIGQRAHRVAHAQAADAVAERDDVAGDLESDHRRRARRRRVASLSLRDVGTVDAGPRHPDQHLAGRRHRHRHAIDVQDRRRAAGAVVDEFHRCGDLTHVLARSGRVAHSRPDRTPLEDEELATIHNSVGADYAFLEGRSAFSAGVIALPGFEIVRARFAHPLPLAEGFDAIAAHLRERHRPLTALCAAELRSPRPLSVGGFDDFNAAWVAVLRRWGLYRHDLNPVARCNACPVHDAPSEAGFHAFSYTMPTGAAHAGFLTTSDHAADAPGPRGFVLAGYAEWAEGTPFP